MAAYRQVYDSRHVTCRLTAKNQDQLQNPMLSNRVWATFTFVWRGIESLVGKLASLIGNAQYDQSWHLSTQLRSGESTGRWLLWSAALTLPTLLSDSQVLISLIIHGLWLTVSGQVKAHVVLTCTNGVSPNHLPVIVASDRPWATLSTCTH